MTEYDGLTFAPVLVENFGAVLGGDRRHVLDPFAFESRVLLTCVPHALDRFIGR
jgi:hypothetical protein